MDRAPFPAVLWCIIMLQWFERRLDPYPVGDPVEPPKGLLAFCLHYSHGAKKWLALMAFAAATVAIGEILPTLAGSPGR